MGSGSTHLLRIFRAWHTGNLGHDRPLLRVCRRQRIFRTPPRRTEPLLDVQKPSTNSCAQASTTIRRSNATLPRANTLCWPTARHHSLPHDRCSTSISTIDRRSDHRGHQRPGLIRDTTDMGHDAHGSPPHRRPTTGVSAPECRRQ